MPCTQDHRHKSDHTMKRVDNSPMLLGATRTFESGHETMARPHSLSEMKET